MTGLEEVRASLQSSEGFLQLIDPVLLDAFYRRSDAPSSASGLPLMKRSLVLAQPFDMWKSAYHHDPQAT